MTLSDEKRENGDQLAERLGTYGGRIVDVVEDLPDTEAADHLGDQLLRAGTAPGAHYAEARSTQSRDDFIHKVGLAAKEVAESRYWLRVARDGDLVERPLAELIEEADELTAILASSLHTARSNREA